MTRWLVALAVAVLLTGCVGDDRASEPRSPTTTTTAPAAPTSSSTTSSTTTIATPTTTTSTTSTTTTTTTPAEPLHLRRGDEGPAVAAFQQRLQELGYWLPEADGEFGLLTEQAVLAFQKVEGFERNGVVGDLTVLALGTATRPEPRHGDRDGVEVDLERQVLYVVHGGIVTEVHNTSTGRPGWRTRPGTFSVYRQIDGMRHAPLGKLWRPKYFDRGIALHGSTSIPAHPASHGCVRLSYPAIDHLWATDTVPLGTTVTVY